MLHMMSNRNTRKAAVMRRLKHRLEIQSQSLAEQFDFRMVVEFSFKDEKKPAVLYEASQVFPVMTNDFESNVMEGAKKSLYSLQSGEDLLKMDVVQLHASHFYSVNPLNATSSHTPHATDLLIGSDSDIDRLQCSLYSRWKGDNDSPYKRIQQEFQFQSMAYNGQLQQIEPSQKTDAVLSNPEQTLFIYIRKQIGTNKYSPMYKLSGLCLFLPQSNLLSWDGFTSDNLSLFQQQS
ncbi:uncharacterized protein C6orf62 homolog [Ciona intestinalis]